MDSNWGDKVNSGIGLSYRPARIHGMAGRYDNPMPELTLSPSDGSMNSTTGQELHVCTLVGKFRREKHVPSGAAVAKIGETCVLHKCCINLHTFRMSQGKR